MITNVVLTALGMLLFWLLRVVDIQKDCKKTGVVFSWALFFQTNTLSFIISLVATAVLYLLLDVKQISAHMDAFTFQYSWAFNFVRIAYFIIGYFNISVITRISSIFEKAPA